MSIEQKKAEDLTVKFKSSNQSHNIPKLTLENLIEWKTAFLSLLKSEPKHLAWMVPVCVASCMDGVQQA